MEDWMLGKAKKLSDVSNAYMKNLQYLLFRELIFIEL
jgi:hypothetical protein